LLPFRRAMYHSLMGENIDGRTAAQWGLINEALPHDQLKTRVEEVARTLLQKNPVALKATKDAVRRVGEMTYDNAEDFLVRAQEAANSYDNEGRKEGIKQFIDDKTFKPGLGAYDKSKQSNKKS
jgi:feruloyl-CoA hydratase/lyase